MVLFKTGDLHLQAPKRKILVLIGREKQLLLMLSFTISVSFRFEVLFLDVTRYGALSELAFLL
ncbi:MAG: hypothetical protein MJK04_17475 [Psychrosphaera sp.]|nr:hypothetical protein [Psychrosphaera sp.]